MEPVFRSIHKSDPDFQIAHARCAETIDEFIALVKSAEEPVCLAKLRFKDPDLSAKEGRDHLFYLWLAEVVYHEDEKLLSGVFFEVPEWFEKWHRVGERLGFGPREVFDWMVIDANQRMRGGYTIRVTRSRLKTEAEKKKFDEYIGVKSYVPV